MEKDLLNAYSSVIASEMKIKILLALNNKVVTPKRIAQKIQKRLNHVSSYLTQLKQKKIVVCLNEQNRKGRLYQLTDLGIRILIELKKNDYSLNLLE